MRVVRFVSDRGEQGFGCEHPDGTVERLGGEGPWARELTGERVRVVKRLAPIDPVNVFCIGLNYREHAKESGAPLPEDPVVFLKPTSAVCHPGDPIRVPACCRRGPEVDWECELAVVIGTTARNVREEEALSYVLGYTAANDVSARKWQRANGGQWVRGKSFDTFCPLGPVLVTADDLPDPQRLGLRTRVNGSLMQQGSTADMIFPVARLIHFLSQDTTLFPGTVILTGTPPGVGFARTPPVFLKPGDVVSVEIDVIGTLTNPVEGPAG